MHEFEIIRRYFTRPLTDDQVRTGIGDDGAVLDPPAGTEIVCVVDSLVAGVHFPRDLAAAAIGYRSVAVNLSDIAAMGATPRWMTLALTLSNAHAEPDWLQDFARGLFAAGDRFDVSLVGGDTTQGAELVISIQLLGTVATGSAIARSGAQEGDDIYVTGTLGDAAAGLHLLQDGAPQSEHSAVLIDRFCRPEPRVGFGKALTRLASAAIDVSDGLFADLGKLLASSQVGARLEFADLPISAALAQRFERERCLRFALSGGDDYELCFTARPQARQDVLALANTSAVNVSKIGTVIAGTGTVCSHAGRIVQYEDTGYRHFAGDQHK